MEQLIHSVLELSRLEAGEMRLKRAPCDLALLTREVVDQLRGLAERRGIALDCVTPIGAGALVISIDRMKIVQVVQNLLGNALKFTPAGGRIDVALYSEDGAITLTVEDTGCGIPPEGGDRLFDKWQQTRAGRARGGSGLGLAIARAIVEAHGGAIGAGDRQDGARGARFFITLPRSAALSQLAM
jgi:signal transduction histidine kinase